MTQAAKQTGKTAGGARRTRRAAKRGPLPILLLGLCLAIAFAILTISRPRMLVQIEDIAYDFLLASLDGECPASDVVVIDVDESSLQQVGQWPWPRRLVARLLRETLDSGAASVGVDFLFTEPDHSSADDLPPGLLDGAGLTNPGDSDEVLAAIISDPRVVLSVWFAFEDAQASADTTKSGHLPEVIVRKGSGAMETPPLPVGNAILSPTPVLSDAAGSLGFLNALPDLDGKIRRAPLLISFAGKTFPSLALASVMQTRDADRMFLRVTAAGLDYVRVGDTTIPTDRQGSMLLRFRENGKACFAHYSAVDVLHGKLEGDELLSKTVFLGSSAAGQKDVHPTPLDRRFPGVYIHAVTADAILRGDFLHRPSWAQGAQFVLVVVCGLLVSLMLARLPLLPSASIALAELVALWVGARWLLSSYGLHISPVAPMGMVAFGFVVLGVVRFRREERTAMLRTRELSVAQDCAILGLVSIAETRDPETGRHIVRTQNYVRLLAEELASQPKYKHQLTTEDIETIYKSAPLHDIGKVGVPDAILLKQGSLSKEEFAAMRTHTLIGHRALVRAQHVSGLDEESSFLSYAGEIALNHHEKWDGTGYPYGLEGDEIPISGRLMALADVYDALRSARPYKEAFTHERATEIITSGRGSHFDPDVVDAFLRLEDEFVRVAAEYADEEEPGE